MYTDVPLCHMTQAQIYIYIYIYVCVCVCVCVCVWLLYVVHSYVAYLRTVYQLLISFSTKVTLKMYRD